MDPHVVLGGFPTTPKSFRNYSADATAFVVTYPVNSDPENRVASEAWEAAFIELASTKLTHMAHEAGLELSFSSERSVQVWSAEFHPGDVLISTNRIKTRICQPPERCGASLGLEQGPAHCRPRPA